MPVCLKILPSPVPTIRMPAILVNLEYLRKLPLYDPEKPYWCFLPPREDFDLEFEDHADIKIENIREIKSNVKIGEWGFEVLEHRSNSSKFDRADDVEKYRSETEELLSDKMDAVHVKCYDSRLRKNVPFIRSDWI